MHELDNNNNNTMMRLANRCYNIRITFCVSVSVYIKHDNDYIYIMFTMELTTVHLSVHIILYMLIVQLFKSC